MGNTTRHSPLADDSNSRQFMSPQNLSGHNTLFEDNSKNVTKFSSFMLNTLTKNIVQSPAAEATAKVGGTSFKDPKWQSVNKATVK